MIDGFVLAGGRSRRMGFDKARAPWLVDDGWVPLAVAAALSLRPVCERIALVRRVDDGLPWTWPEGGPLEVVWEPDEPETHVLLGIATALRHARTPLVALVPADVPGLGAASWRALVEAAPAVAFDGERVHAPVLVVPPSQADRAAELARAGASARAFVEPFARVQIPEPELADHDDRASLPTGPVAALLARAPLGDDAARRRLADGERSRLAARGVLDPEDESPLALWPG